MNLESDKGPYYVLIDCKPTKCSWSAWLFSTTEQSRYLSRWQTGGVIVSTIFTGVDYSLGTMIPPLLWETRINGGPMNDKWQRYATAEAARNGHRKWVRKAKQALQKAEVVQMRST